MKTTDKNEKWEEEANLITFHKIYKGGTICPDCGREIPTMGFSRNKLKSFVSSLLKSQKQELKKKVEGLKTEENEIEMKFRNRILDEVTTLLKE